MDYQLKNPLKTKSFQFFCICSFFVLPVLTQFRSEDISTICPDIRIGEDDLPGFDLIRKFGLDDSETTFPGVKVVRGSNRMQKAYRLSKRSNLILPTRGIFPLGLPEQFSFASTFRKRQGRQDPWHLLQITNAEGQHQFAVTIHPRQKELEMTTVHLDGSLRRTRFTNIDLSSKDWHKIDLSVMTDLVTLYINCEKKATQSLEPRRPIDVNGDVMIAKYEDLGPVLVELQWMVLTCDPTRSARENCNELPALKRNTTVCPICPSGPPGTDGLPGSPGDVGAPGPPGLQGLQGPPGPEGPAGPPGLPGEVVTDIPDLRPIKNQQELRGPRGYKGPPGPPGERGRQGERGPPGIPSGRGMPGPAGPPGAVGNRGPPGMPGLPGPPGRSFSEEEVRDICFSVLRDQMEELTRGLRGPPGAPGIGLPGKPGQQGKAGIPGDPGPPGLPGERGFMGMPGVPGPHGPPGNTGEKGEKGDRGPEGVGVEGPMGVRGVPGPPGSPGIGIPGRIGDRGPPGRQGLSGARGEPGPQGPPGYCELCNYHNSDFANYLQPQINDNKGQTVSG